MTLVNNSLLDSNIIIDKDNFLEINDNFFQLKEHKLFFTLQPQEAITFYIRIKSSYDWDLTFNCYSNCHIKIIIIVEKVDNYNSNNKIKFNYLFNYYNNQIIDLFYLNIDSLSITENFEFNLSAPAAAINFYLASLASNNNKKNISVQANHLAKKTFSHLKIYGIIKNEAREVVKCISNIVKKMAKSETSQEIRLLVFDEQGTAISDPILLIDENDIIASHANAVGMLNPYDLFYLQSRGLSLIEARKLIIMGYFQPVINAIQDDKLQAQIIEKIIFQIEEEKF